MVLATQLISHFLGFIIYVETIEWLMDTESITDIMVIHGSMDVSANGLILSRTKMLSGLNAV